MHKLKECYELIRKNHANVYVVNDEKLERIEREYSKYIGLTPFIRQIYIILISLWLMLFNYFVYNLIPEMVIFQNKLAVFFHKKI